MSKKRDPLSVIIHYFNTVDLPAAEQASVIVREIVRSRQPVRAATKKKPAAPRRAAEVDPPLPLN